MGAGNRKGYWDVLGYPLSMWIVYLILFSLLASVGLYRFSTYFFSGTGLVVMAALFGFWSGARASKVIRGGIGMGMLSGFMLGFVAGLVGLLLMLGIGALLPAFAVSAAGSDSILALFSLGVGSWVIAVMVSTLASAIGNEFANR